MDSSHTNNESGKTVQELNADENGDQMENTKCGLGGWSPNWLQVLASKKVFLLVYGFLGVNEMATTTYFNSTLSTMEKRFKLPSALTGLMSSSYDLGMSTAILIVAYFGGTGHKTRWVACCSMAAGFACYIMYMPQLIFGPGQLKHGSNSTNFDNENLCVENKGGILENCDLNYEAKVAVGIFLFGYMLAGAGSSSYFTLGASYLDDNVSKDKFPFLFALLSFLRYFGPSAGFLLSTYTLSIFIDPNIQPTFGKEDPRWIGAWYKGWFPLGTIAIILASFMAFFPRALPRAAERRKNDKNFQQPPKRSLKELREAMKRLFKNPILMLNTFSSMFYLFGTSGFYVFMPKYIETQFRQSASTASFVTGTVGLACTAAGLLASGVIISNFKPRPRFVAAWNVITETCDVIGHLCLIYLGCYKADFQGSYKNDGSWELNQDCNSNCNCDASNYSPVCSYDKTATFYSPCHAGCTYFDISNETKIFSNCSCISNYGYATDGTCPVDCVSDFYIFITVLSIMKFLSASGQAGNIVIQYRSVSSVDKSLSIALSELTFCVLAFVPAPIVFGLILDHFCLVWGTICGKPGNCWVYDEKKLRVAVNFTSAGFMCIGTLLDIGVWYFSGSLEMYEDSDGQEETNESKHFDMPLIETNKSKHQTTAQM